jgi:hypothetical protein
MADTIARYHAACAAAGIGSGDPSVSELQKQLGILVAADSIVTAINRATDKLVSAIKEHREAMCGSIEEVLGVGDDDEEEDQDMRS